MIFRKKNKNYDASSYIQFISKSIVDKNLTEEIIEKIKYFSDNGTVKIDGNNLYAKIYNKEGNDYFEIKYDAGHFVCYYTMWNSHCMINIEQIKLSDNCVKIEKKEKIEYVCLENNNKTGVKEIEKIYDKDGKLIYESSLDKDVDYDLINGKIKYRGLSVFFNSVEQTKYWYISNGSIICYRMRKHSMDQDSKLNEYYSICKERNRIDGVFYFRHLDEQLFKDFMTGRKSIEVVLEENAKILSDMDKKLIKIN